MQPLAEKLGALINIEPDFSGTAYAAAPDKARQRAVALVSDRAVRVLCSQGKVIPDLHRAGGADRDGITLPPARNRKGSVWVLSFHDDRMVAADHIDSPMALEVPLKN